MLQGGRLPILVVGGLLALAGLLGWWWGRPEPAPPLMVEPVPAPQASQAATITVHVAGLVRRPGLAVVAEGARVADAIAAVGGALPGADLSALNLAQPVADGERIVVLAAGSPGGAASPETTGDGRIHLNTASADELDRLPGVGPVLAERIVAYREAHGPFRAVEDLLDVPGIGEGKLASLRDVVVVP